jgi:hypothetical protein
MGRKTFQYPVTLTQTMFTTQGSKTNYFFVLLLANLYTIFYLSAFLCLFIIMLDCFLSERNGIELLERISKLLLGYVRLEYKFCSYKKMIKRVYEFSEVGSIIFFIFLNIWKQFVSSRGLQNIIFRFIYAEDR